MKLENKLFEIETKLREAAETRNIIPPVRQALRDAIDAIVKAQRELACPSRTSTHENNN